MMKFKNLVYAIRNKKKIQLAVFNGERAVFQPYGIIDNLVNGNLTIAGAMDRNGILASELVELSDVKEVELLPDGFVTDSSWSNRYVETKRYKVIITG